MKNSTILKTAFILLIFLTGYISINAQTVTVNGNSMIKYVPAQAGEDPDLVTTGTRIPYLVVPDPDLNPSYVLATDGSSVTNVLSSFTWTLPAGFSIFNTTPTPKHYVELNVTGAASPTAVTLNVKENSASSCGDAAGTDIKIQIVAQPNITNAKVTDGAGGSSTCATGTNGSLNVPLPTFNITSSIDAAISTPNIKVKATLEYTPLNGTATSVTNKVLAVDASGNISNTDFATAFSMTTFKSWGTYKLTFTYISDKISRKDIETGKTDGEMDKGYFKPTTTFSATYTVLKTPKTGDIYHISNSTM